MVAVSAHGFHLSCTAPLYTMPTPLPRTARFLAPMLLAAFVAGCATPPPIEELCPPTDWHQAGLRDGSRGMAPKPLQEHVAACAKGGVTIDTSDYMPGWNEGIAQFCTGPNGWKQGVQGNQHRAGACTGQPEEAAFTQHMAKGLEVFKLNEQRRANALQLQALNQKHNTNRNPLERRKLQEEMTEIDKKQTLLRRQLATLQMQEPQ
jgi:hypothetical protein